MNICKKTSKSPVLFGIFFILVALQFGVDANISCRKPFQNLKLPPHTKLARRQSSSGREIKLKCDSGHFFTNGNSRAVVKCRNGTVTNPLPSCRGCSPPPEINNGTRNVSKTSFKVTYSCDVGFTLVGPRERRCRKSLKWSGTKASFCRRNKCVAPKRLALRNGNVTTTDASYHEFTTLSFECDEGYELRGEEDVICRDSKWTAKFPRCRKKRCPDPGRPENGRRYGGYIFYIGSRVQFFCHSGFTLYGSSQKTCQKDKTWTGTLTTCDDGQFHCRDPGIPIGGVKTGKRYNLGNVVRYYCKSGLKLEGSNNRTCLSNKTWSGVQPKCVDENYRVFPPINETMQFLREGFVDSLLQTTCSGKNISCPKVDTRARSLHKNYKAGLDLIFVLDTSSSITENNFKIAKDFIKTIVKIFGVNGKSRDGTRIACVTYATVAKLEFGFQHGSVENLQSALKKIEKIVYSKGGTATRLALETVEKVVLPLRRKGSTVAMFMVTDGDSNVGGDPREIAKTLREKNNVEIYVVGIGNKVKHDSLKQLASPRYKDHIFAVKDFDALRKVKKWIVKYPSTDYSKCGVAHYNPNFDGRARVVGGKVVKKRDWWPWAVEVDVDGQHCGGTIISTKYILTAAHCFYRKQIFIDPAAAQVKVFFGGKRDYVRTSRSYEIHPNYDKKTYYYDIALIEIPELRRYSRHKQAICLPRGLDMTKIIKPGDSLFAVGWGSTDKAKPGEEGKDLSDDLKQVKIPFSDDTKCIDKVQEMLDKNVKNWYFNNATQFCATDPSGQNDTCAGDSGGPAMVLHRNPEDGKDRWYQVGIVSWGNGCAHKGEYGYYTKVSAFFKWLDKYI